MRLVDKWFLDARKNAVPGLSDLPISFVVDNIARDYYHDERDEFKGADFPYSIPPWPYCFVEWEEPATMRKGGAVYATDVARHGHGKCMMGALVEELPDKKVVDGTWAMLKAMCGAHKSWTDAPDKISQATRGYVARMCCEIYGRFLDWKVALFVFTDGDGLPLFNVSTGVGLRNAEASGRMEEVNKMFQSVYHVLGFAFTFSHCKNVAKVDSTQSLKMPSKIERRLKLPKFQRYTLKINGSMSAASTSSSIGPPPAYHLCRGHFATYTAERPLFGRLTGRFWIPAHTKGKREHGEVVKGYETKSR